jgi:hypothetical protein
MGSSREDLNDKLDSIDPTKTNYRIIKNIDNDEKYFVSEDGKAEFDKLSVDDMRNKKVYYESGYNKLAKGETESDLTKYLGGKAAHEELINKIKDVIESYKLMFILTAFTVVVTIVLAYILASLIKAQQPIIQIQAPGGGNLVGKVNNKNKVLLQFVASAINPSEASLPTI